MRAGMLIFAALAIPGPLLCAQKVPTMGRPVDSAAYLPRLEVPDGNQIVVVYFGMTGSGYDRDPVFSGAIRRMKPLLSRQADSLGRPLTMNGVVLDWGTQSGVAYLTSLGNWDEITIGNNWTSMAATRYLWNDPKGRPAVPQVVLYERNVTANPERVTIGPEHRLGQFVGVEEIVRWVDAGAHIPVRK
jgi:hypothetical protein